MAQIEFGTSSVSKLADAMELCDPPSVGITFDDDDGSISFDSKGEEDASGADVVDVACLLAVLETPDRIVSHIDQTTSLDGRQTETWDSFEIQWSYHPNRGMDGVISVSD
ncbi:MAG: hypothetical protein ACTHW1_09730 [Ancrocorticia sp.]|uniref:hypothetical protein n=1 Tax=Ancrocorticia sp. TaxID=2593684 RepID=UPI003F8E4C06